MSHASATTGRLRVRQRRDDAVERVEGLRRLAQDATPQRRERRVGLRDHDCLQRGRLDGGNRGRRAVFPPAPRAPSVAPSAASPAREHGSHRTPVSHGRSLAPAPCGRELLLGPTVPGELIEIEQARRLVLERTSPLRSEPVPLRDASTGCSPPTSRPRTRSRGSTTRRWTASRCGRRTRGGDGRCAGQPRGRRRVARRAPAAAPVGAGEAILISTGAMVPDGADAVVRVEDTSARDGRVEVSVAIDAGATRRRGEDIGGGDASCFRPERSSAPPSSGCWRRSGARTRLHPTPRVAVLTTRRRAARARRAAAAGRCAQLEHPLGAGAGHALRAEVATVEMVPDDAAATRAAIEGALAADVSCLRRRVGRRARPSALRSPSSASTRCSGASPCVPASRPRSGSIAAARSSSAAREPRLGDGHVPAPRAAGDRGDAGAEGQPPPRDSDPRRGVPQEARPRPRGSLPARAPRRRLARAATGAQGSTS